MVDTGTRISLVLNTPVKIECIVFSTYYKRMVALTYVPVHVLQNPCQNLTKITQCFSFFVPRSTTGLYVTVRYRVTVLQLVRTVCETRNMLRMYNYNNKNSSTVKIKMVFPQRSPHHQQKQGHQHKSKRTGYCAKLAAEKFATLGEIYRQYKGNFDPSG